MAGVVAEIRKEAFIKELTHIVGQLYIAHKPPLGESLYPSLFWDRLTKYVAKNFSEYIQCNYQIQGNSIVGHVAGNMELDYTYFEIKLD